MALSNYYKVYNEICKRIKEPSPSRIQILVGPRQIGKTHMLLNILESYPDNAYYFAMDSPEVNLPDWWEIQWNRIFRLAESGEQLIILLDEIQFYGDWSIKLKSKYDEIHRKKYHIHLVVTGSASLKIGKGARESLAGRFERLELCHWTPYDLSKTFNLSEQESIEIYINYGYSPGSLNMIPDFNRWKDYIKNSIIEPAIGRDLLLLELVRKPALLAQVYAICAGHPAEIISLNKIAGYLTDKGNLETIAHYLKLLNEAFLITPIYKFASNQIRIRASLPKVICRNNAFVRAFSGETNINSNEYFGRILENACIAFSINQGYSVYYWRDNNKEVDFIIPDKKIAVEVKSSDISLRDVAGLFEFCKRNQDYKPILICNEANLNTAKRIGVDAISYQNYLWNGFDS